jgi:hypothetical protein
VALIDLGINSNSISYEVALEVLGQSQQPLISARNAEKSKESPSPALLAYLSARISALDDLVADLNSKDMSTIELILSPEKTSIFKT